MSQYELNLNEYWRIIKKRKTIVFFALATLAIFSLIFAIMNPPTPIYSAAASIQIEKSTDMTGLYMQSLSWGSGDVLATRAEVIKSFPIVELAAKKMGIIDSNLTSAEIISDKGYYNIIARLKNKIRTQQEGYTNILTIIVDSYDKKEASTLANTIVAVYKEENFRQKYSKQEKALQSLKIQLQKAEALYRSAVMQVEEYKQKFKFITVDGRVSRLTKQLNDSETKLSEINDDIRQIDNILSEISRNPEYISYLSINLLLNQKNNVLGALQSELHKLEARRNELQIQCTDDHPSVKQVDRQINNIKRRFITELENFKTVLNRLKKAEADKYNKFNTEYKQLPTQGIKVSNMERELEINRTTYQQLKVSYHQAVIKKSEQVEEIFVIKPAFEPTSPINPTNIFPTTAVGTIVGLILGIVLAFIAETLDTTFRTIDDIETSLETRVRGIIPFVRIEDVKATLEETTDSPISDEILNMQARLISHYSPKSQMAESFRNLRTNVNFALTEKGQKAFMVTSSVPGEGKTTIAVNLALSMAQIGYSTLLVECDLRKPRLSKLFGLNKEPGLSDVLLRRNNLEDVIRSMSDLMMGSMSSDAIRPDSIPGIEYLNILTSGRIERNPSELIAGKEFGNVVEELKKLYDIVIFDSPPVIQTTDAVIMSSKVESTLIVYYQGKIFRNTLRRTTNQLRQLKADILGVVINGMRSDISADYADYRYEYSYSYSYGDHEIKLTGMKKIVNDIINYFLREKEGIEQKIWKRLRKLRILLIIAILSGVSVSGFLLVKFISSLNKPVIPSIEELKMITPDSLADSIFQTIPMPETENENIIPQQTVQYSPPGVSQEEQETIQYTSTEISPTPQYADTNQSVTPNVTEQKIPQININQDEYKQPPPNPVLKNQQTTGSKYSPVYDGEQAPAKITNVQKTSQLHSILIKKMTNLSSAKYEVKKLREEGLPVFASVDYSNPSSKMYLVCYGNFTSSVVNSKIQELSFLGFDGLLEPIKLPFVLLSPGTLDQTTKNRLNIFTYSKSESGRDQTLIGAFASRQDAELFKHSHPELLQTAIINR